MFTSYICAHILISILNYSSRLSKFYLPLSTFQLLYAVRKERENEIFSSQSMYLNSGFKSPNSFFS